MEKSQEILNEVENKIEMPFVTAKFGYGWREHQKRMLEEGQIDIDMILNIAWRQGRKSILLEDVIKKLVDK